MYAMGKWSITNKSKQTRRHDKPEWEPYWVTHSYNKATKENVEHMKKLLAERQLYLRFYYYHKHNWICQEAVHAIINYLEGNADKYQERKYKHFVTPYKSNVYFKPNSIETR
jgi:hypothetical protein